MNNSGNNANEQFNLKETYKTFVSQMSDWYNGGELPELAGQDLRFVLELQKQKLQSLGIDMQCTIKNTGSTQNDVSGISFGDRIFINSGVNGNMGMTRSFGSNQNQFYKSTKDIGLTAIIQNLKSGVRPDASMALCCPHCGAPSTLEELESGCKHCDTHFLMSELYPKVMNFFIYEPYDSARNSAKNKKDLIILITLCSLVMIPLMMHPETLYSLLARFAQVEDQIPDTTEIRNLGILGSIFSGIFSGAMLGVILFGFKKLFEIFGVMGKDLRGVGHTAPTLLRANKIKQHDPEFSSEHFRDKIMSLFRMVVYSRDTTDLACCKCQCPQKATDIIEAQLHNFNINSCKIKDMVCDAEVTLFLDCIHYRKGKIKSKTEKFRMRIRKHIKNPTELGFSFAAVSCPSCGASFDARKVKACPYCNNEYLHEEHDWIVIDIR